MSRVLKWFHAWRCWRGYHGVEVAGEWERNGESCVVLACTHCGYREALAISSLAPFTIREVPLPCEVEP